jgi:hypothetical protein
MGVVIGVVFGSAIIYFFFNWLFDEVKNQDKNREKRYRNYHYELTAFFHKRNLHDYPHRDSSELYMKAQDEATQYIANKYPEMIVRK